MSSDPTGAAVYSIGQFAKLTLFPIKTLRYYDEEEVLKPAAVDPVTGYRSYTEAQRRPMHLLAELHLAHLPVDSLREFMRDPTPEHQGRLFDWKIGQLEAELKEKQIELRTLRRKRTYPWQEQQYEVTTQAGGPRPFVFLHYFTNLMWVEDARSAAVETLQAHLAQHGVTPSSPPMQFSVPTTDARRVLTSTEVYVGFEVEHDLPVAGKIRCGSTPGGLWYGVTHRGPYEHIWHVQPMLLHRVQQDQGNKTLRYGAFLSQEIYHVGPWDTTEVGDWITEERWLVHQDDAGSIISTDVHSGLGQGAE